MRQIVCKNDIYVRNTKRYVISASKRGSYLDVGINLKNTIPRFSDVLNDFKTLLSAIEKDNCIIPNTTNPSKRYRRFAFWSSAPERYVGFTVYLPYYNKQNLYESVSYHLGEAFCDFEK